MPEDKELDEAIAGHDGNGLDGQTAVGEHPELALTRAYGFRMGLLPNTGSLQEY